MDDDAGPHVEFLDDWDSVLPPEPPRPSNTRLLLPFGLVLVLAVIVTLAMGGAGRAALDPLLSRRPTPTPTQAPTFYQPIDVASEGIFTPAPPSDDVDALPLIVSLAETIPRTADGILSYRVSVCVSGTVGSAAGGRVPILRNFWTLVSRTSNELLAPTDAGPQPVFPREWYYLKGQCATGYISFQASADFVPQYLTYQDNRFQWSWRIT
jgi:hypothetical protein